MEGVKQILSEAIKARGRGSQTALAEALGVRPQTVNKWVQGQTVPDMERWAEIEDALDLERGTLWQASGVTLQGSYAQGGRVDHPDEIAELREQIAAIEVRMDQLMERLASLVAPPDTPEPPTGPAASPPRSSSRRSRSAGS